MSSSNGNDEDKSGNWWDGWLNKAKEKSITTLQLIKNDLNEFSETMKSDFNQITTQLQATNKPLIEALTTLDLKTSKTIASATSKNTHEQEATLTDSFDRKKNEILSIQNNEETYMNDYANDENYQIYQDSYDPDTLKGEISNLLIENSTMRGLYSQLVPASLSHKQFWSRYYYKVKLIEEEYDRRQKLIEKATSGVAAKEGLAWDENEDEEDEEGEEASEQQVKESTVHKQISETKTEDSDWEKVSEAKEADVENVTNEWENWD